MVDPTYLQGELHIPKSWDWVKFDVFCQVNGSGKGQPLQIGCYEEWTNADGLASMPSSLDYTAS